MKLEQAFAFGVSDQSACFYAGIGAATLYEYQKNHPEFAERKTLLKERPILKAEQVIVDALNNNDVDTARWYLSKKRPDVYGDKDEQKDYNITINVIKYGNNPAAKLRSESEAVSGGRAFQPRTIQIPENSSEGG